MAVVAVAVQAPLPVQLADVVGPPVRAVLLRAQAAAALVQAALRVEAADGAVRVGLLVPRRPLGAAAVGVAAVVVVVAAALQ